MAATLFALGVAEAIARALWVAPWQQRLIDEQAESQRIEYAHNRWGLRDRDYPARGPRDRRRVLLLGDSFTYGLGVADDAAIFPEILERQLSASVPGGVDVLNGGIPASLTDDWIALWRRVVGPFDPDAVVAVFFLRDGTPFASIPEFFDRIRGQLAYRDREAPLYRYSYLFRFARDRISRAEIAERYTRAFRRAYLGDAEERAEWERAQANLLWLRDDAARRSIAMGLAVFPVLVELSERHPFRDVDALVERFAVENGIPVHDLLPDFRGRRAPDLWVSPLDQHPNARAHAIAADALLPFVESLIRTAGARVSRSGSDR